MPKSKIPSHFAKFLNSNKH